MEKEEIKIVQEDLPIIGFLDEARWSKEKNYGNMLLSKEMEKANIADEMLIHWLSYIEDRQTDYRKVWKIGTFAFSKIVEKYKRFGTKAVLENFEGKNKKLKIQIDESETKNKELIEFEKNFLKEKEKTYLCYSLRYKETDYESIERTLKILEKFANKNLIEYLATAINTYMGKIRKKEENRLGNNIEEEFVNVMAYALYYLTYQIGKKVEKVKEIIKNKKCDFYEKIFKENKFEQNRFKCKRLWCALRDYLKSKQFKEQFQNELLERITYNKSQIQEILKKDNNKRLLNYLELPGDVWNNNFKFRNCIIVKENNTYIENKKEIPLNKLLREIYNKEKNNKKESCNWYPEQFDITFNLASRMCKNDNCEICPLAIYKNENQKEKIKERIRGICNYKTNKFVDRLCPIALILCDYKLKCKGENCEIYKIIKDVENENEKI